MVLTAWMLVVDCEFFNVSNLTGVSAGLHSQSADGPHTPQCAIAHMRQCVTSPSTLFASGSHQTQKQAVHTQYIECTF